MKELQSLNPYIKRYWKELLLGVFFLIGTNFFLVLSPKFVAESVDALGRPNFALPDIYSTILFGVLSSAAAGFFLFLVRQTIIVVSRKIEFDLKNDFYAHLQTLDFLYFKANSTGDLMSRATNDLNAVRNYLGPGIMYSTNTLFRLIFALTAMFTISPSLTLFVMLPAPLISFIVYFLGKKIHDRSQELQEKYSAITSKVQENLSGARIVKAYTREDAEIQSFLSLNTEYYHKNLTLAKLQALFFPSITALIGFSIMLVIFVGGNQVIEGVISLGTIVQFLIYVLTLSWPLISIGWVTNIIQRAAASQKRLNEILLLKPSIRDTVHTDVSLKEIHGAIEFRSVSYSYPSNPSKKVLDSISFKIEKGARAAIVGATGVGKSTFVHLIPRLIEPISGEILIDGRRIQDFPISVLRNNIGFVPQDYFLFSDTVQNNIAFGVSPDSPYSDFAFVKKAAEEASLYDDVKDFPDQFSTMLGERGITLSGGQKQRTAIARALLRHPKILILDDSLSAVDTKTEDTILSHLFSDRESTILLISHRISTVKNCDVIFVLHDSKIVESGSHDTLLNANGYYSELYRKQQLEEEISSLD